MNKKWLMVPIGIAAIALFTFLGGSVVKWLWNWLMPMLFGLREVTFWQAVGILALSRILFGGLGIGGNRSRGRWERHMSPEERERFRQRMRNAAEWAKSPPKAPGRSPMDDAGPATQ